MARIAKTYTGNKVPRLTKFLFPFSGIFRDACYALVGSFLLQYAINSGVLSSAESDFTAQYWVITVAMMVALVWDGINDPIMGFVVEKVHFKLGKFKPWILIGAIGNALAVVCMFLIRPTNADGSANGWAFVGVMIAFYFLWDLFFTMNDIGYWSMLPSLTNDEKERATLTSRMTICASIGGFLMTAACMLLPTMFAGISSATMYMILAIVTAILFLGSQVAVFFLCQERQRDPKQEEASEQSSLLDLFKVVGKNPQVRVAVIAMFLYYLASGVLTGGIGLNYFYLSLGYGSGRGGLISALISVMYVIGMVASQALYPVLAKKLPKKKILLISFIIQLVGFAGFIFCCVPLFGDHPIAYNVPASSDFSAMDFGWALGGTMGLYYVFPLVFFFGMGMMYLVIMVMLQDAIDYNEYQFGERKESIISAWRPLDVKLSSALLRLFQIVIFSVAGLLTAVNQISDAERAHNIWTNTKHNPGEVDPFPETIAAIQASVKPESIRVAGILIVVILVVSVVAAWACLQFGYGITEEKHREIVEELERRHAANGLAEEKPLAPEIGIAVGQEPTQAEFLNKDE
ncbi:MAG: MFS transporter [Erysipelotrichaceae bacterium]|jgi:melibiose permease/lactose/raffinose/galactose permease|nr:MFS transporter [Erysipelotrichaceae bacterium]